MSHPASQPSSQALSPEVRELLNEIAFQKVLLNSLNDTVENREEAEREISAEIKTLEKQLRHLKRCTTSTASNCTPSASQFFSQATPSNSTTTKPAAMESNHSRPPGNTPQGSDSILGLGSTSSTASTPNSTMDPLPDLTSPISLRNRKRTHSKHLDSGFGDFSGSKSRRTSPSPYMMGAAMTPGSSSGDDDFPALGDEDFLNQIQKKQEDQMEQEKLDEEFARALQDDNSFASIMTESPSRPLASRGPSAFDMMAGRQSKKPTSGSSAGFSVDSRYHTAPRKTGSTNSGVHFNATSPTYSRASSSSSGNIYAPTSPTCDKPNVPLSNFADFESTSYGEKPKNKSSKVKAEPGSSRQMSGAFSSSHDSDSDIEIIDATQFNDNGHHRPSSSSTNFFDSPRKASKRPDFTPESQTAGDAALRRRKHGTSNDALHLATFGNMQQPEWVDSGSREGSLSSIHRPGSAGFMPSMNSGMVNTQPYGAGNYMNPGMGMQGPRQTPFMNPNAASVYGSGNAGYNGIENMPGSFPGGNMQVPGHHLGYTVNNIPSYDGYNLNQHPP